MAKPPLSLEDICARLDTILQAEFTFIRTEQPAEVIAELPRMEQDYILNWVERIASTNIQIAYQFITRAIDALASMDKQIIEAWGLHAMDTYDKSGLHAAMEVMKNLDSFVQDSHQRETGAVLDEVSNVLLHFSHGLSGRQLKLQESQHAWTDTETIFLPSLLAQLPDKQSNFRLYKAMVAMCWAQTRFGSFRVPLQEVIAQQDKPHQFVKLFHALETLRLEACIKRELPGLYRNMQELRRQTEATPRGSQWQELAEELSDPDKTAEDALALAQQFMHKLDVPAPLCYQGQIKPEEVAACMQRRMEKEKAQFRTVLRDISEELKKADGEKPRQHQFDMRKQPDPTRPEGFRLELTMDGEVVKPPDIINSLSTSIVQDIGEIPDDYLTPAGDGEYDPTLFMDKEIDPEDVWNGTYHEEGAFLYNEWDYRRQHYRKNWCAVRELEITPVQDDFVNNTLHKYQGLIKHLRKTFEAMRDEDRMLKRQVHGDGVDIDALVEALADARDGSEMSDRLFQRMHRTERNIAVCFMVDMSGSTKGWINDAERESLILLAETLETLNDRYAIYGFSGMARKRCEIYKIKQFDEPYNEVIKSRITGIVPKDYTRMGFAIRHLSKLLNGVEARTRILITISDGKPDDYDNYRGEYGIEDTRRALIEARRSGIHPYCITIDREARDYLPHMYGPAGFSVIDEVRKLPLKVSDIYRRLTT